MPAASPLRPSNDELRRLYVDERLPSTAIAQRCQVEKFTVLRWLRAAGIERRPAGRNLANRGGTAPTVEELRALVHDEHLSYDEIADRFGVDRTTVPFWLRKHGIPRPTVWVTRRRGQVVREPTEQELRDRLSEGESLASIAREFELSRGLLRARCQQFGIEVQRDGWQGGHRFTCADGHLARSTYEQRVDDWLSERGIEHEVEPAYPWDRRYRADFRVGTTYIEVWGVIGNPKYKERQALKIARCKAEGIDLVSVHHWQFAKGRRWWRPLLQVVRDAE